MTFVSDALRDSVPDSTADLGDLPVRSDWFDRTDLEEGIVHIIEPEVNPFLRANMWLIQGSQRSLLVDTGMGVAPLKTAFPDLFKSEPTAFITHGHYDHTGGAHEFSDVWTHHAEAPALTQPEEATLLTAELSPSFTEALAADTEDGIAPPCLINAVPHPNYDISGYHVTPVSPTRLLSDGDRIDLGDRSVVVLHIPGHTPGSAALYDQDTGSLFTGDMVYEGELLDELPESNIADYVSSMRRLMTLSVHKVYPGHEGTFDGDRLLQLIDGYLRLRAN